MSTAGSGTLALARKLVPDAITLDLGLSDIDGWVLFDLLRHDPKTRGIPIHVISGADDLDALARKGATSVSTKPVSSEELTRVFEEIHKRRVRTQHNVLVADADPDRRLSLVDAIRDGVTSVTAIARLAANADEAEFRPLRCDRARPRPLGQGECADAGTISSASLGEAISKLLIYAPSFDSLDQSIALNPAVANVPRAENLAQLGLLMSAVLPTRAESGDAATVDVPDSADIARAKVLIVDDDIRNIYSLTSVLETYDIQVLHAERGRDGIAILEQNPDIDVALIDIMMPEMDGYETMREIRRRPAIADIPLISVTAKAMKGDRQKCLEAGASDYIAKPVDLDLLLALLRVWVARSRSRRSRQGSSAVAI